jgi:Zn-dependent protease
LTGKDRKIQRLLLTGILFIFLFVSAAAGATPVSPVQVQNISDIPVMTLKTIITPTPNPTILLTRVSTTVAQLTGVMVIESIPSGASLSIDGTVKGTTPFTIRTITAGDHTVTLKMTGYKDFITTVTVPPGGNVQGVYTMVSNTAGTGTGAVNPLQPATGTMIIESIPSGASLFIDGTLAGTTPYTSHTIATGDHALSLKMDGYADFPSTATIPAGGEFREIYTLSCNVLSVNSIPSGASLSIDGTVKGTTPYTIRAIRAGDHVVTLSMTGYEDYTTTVTIPQGVEVTMIGTMVSVTTGNVPVTVLPSVSGTTQVPVTRGMVTTIPSGTTVPVPLTETTQHITREQSGNCTMHYFGSGKLNAASDGRLNCTTFISTDDHITTLRLQEGTLVTGGEQTPVPEIRITPVNPPDIPSDAGAGGSRWTGRAYHYLPDHTSFDPPVLVSFTLGQDEWNRSDPVNLTIKETDENGPGWEDLPTTIDPVTRTISAPARHFSIIGLFSTSPVANPPVTSQSPVDIIRTAIGSKNVPLPLSPILPDKYAPLAAVVAGVTLSVIGTLTSGSTVLSRLWDKITELLNKFLGSETIGLMNASEIEKRGIRPSENLSAILLGISSREILVIGTSTLGFAAAFILQDHLELKLTTVIIFVCVGGIATILHDLAHKYCAYRAGYITEYQFWGLGTVTMLSTAWLFGNAFAKPSRTVIRSEENPSSEEAAIIKLAGPLMSMAVAIVSLFLIPLGGLFVIAGSAGFSMNLLNCVFSLVPVKPNDGVEIYAWNKLVWATVFIPLIVFYLYIYLPM